MGKRLIIRGADFSTNAVYSETIVWSEMSLLEGFIVSNPSSSIFGTISTVTTTDNYKKLARLQQTIKVEPNQTLRLRIYNINNEQKNIYVTSVGYQSAWSGSTIPSSALPAVSLYYAAQEYRAQYTWKNETSQTMYFQACVGVENVTILTESNYVVKYYVE